MSEPIFTCICDEPEGKIERSVYKMPLTYDNLTKFWEKSRQFKTLFSKEINDDMSKFVELFLAQDGNELTANGLFWVVDDFVGVYYLTDIYAPFDAQTHYTFFDRRHKGRSDMTRKMVEHVFNKFQFHRLSVEVPLYAKSSLSFIESVGFKKEGRKRDGVFFNNQFFDCNLYGILKSEVESGQV